MDGDDRQELVRVLSSEGMSIRAIAPIVGAQYTTVASDRVSTVGNPTVEESFDSGDPDVAFTEPESRPIIVLNGKTYLPRPPLA